MKKIDAKKCKKVEKRGHGKPASTIACDRKKGCLHPHYTILLICSKWAEKVFAVSKIKNTVPWIYFVSDLSGEKITGSF